MLEKLLYSLVTKLFTKARSFSKSDYPYHLVIDAADLDDIMCHGCDNSNSKMFEKFGKKLRRRYFADEKEAEIVAYILSKLITNQCKDSTLGILIEKDYDSEEDAMDDTEGWERSLWIDGKNIWANGSHDWDDIRDRFRTLYPKIYKNYAYILMKLNCYNYKNG